jgi:two-component system OmpR family response regulator
MRVLVVEDDEELNGLVRKVLEAEGHVVESATTGADGLWLASEFDFDVVVLDWDLPDLDGLEVCRRLRDADRWMAVLMLTGHRDVQNRVAGLNAGSDDYLTKPFAMDELKARLRALARRAPSARPTVLRAGDLELDPASRQVRRGEATIDLRPKEFSLLELLMRRAGEVLPRSEILEQAWDMNYDGMSNVVDAQVRALRNKIDRPFGCESIKTVWRVGYLLQCE